jgi:hypothetical protein
VPEITVEGWWTTLAEVECPNEKVIALYCDHACVIRAKAASESGASRPPVLAQSGHPF